DSFRASPLSASSTRPIASTRGHVEHDGEPSGGPASWRLRYNAMSMCGRCRPLSMLLAAAFSMMSVQGSLDAAENLRGPMRGKKLRPSHSIRIQGVDAGGFRRAGFGSIDC